MEGRIIGADDRLDHLEEDQIPASRIASEHFDPLTEPNLNVWIFRMLQKYDDAIARIAALEGA